MIFCCHLSARETFRYREKKARVQSSSCQELCSFIWLTRIDDFLLSLTLVCFINSPEQSISPHRDNLICLGVRFRPWRDGATSLFLRERKNYEKRRRCKFPRLLRAFLSVYTSWSRPKARTKLWNKNFSNFHVSQNLCNEIKIRLFDQREEKQIRWHKVCRTHAPLQLCQKL